MRRGALVPLCALAALSAMPLRGAAADTPAGGQKAAAPAQKAATQKAAAPPRYSDLPMGAVPALSTATRPASIPAGERAEGFYPARPYGYSRGSSGEPPYAVVFTSEELAKAQATGRGFGEASDDQTCVLTSMGTSGFGPRASEVLWIPSFQTMASVNGHNGTVQPVRLERLTVKGEGRAELAVAYAWIDTATLGARLATRGTVPLLRVASGPAGVEVYAAASGDGVEVVVTSGAASSERHRVGTMQFFGADGMAGSDGGCGHLRFSLPAAPGDGATVTVQGDVLIVEGEARGEGSLLDSLVGGARTGEVRARPLRLGVSSSWMSRDPEPVISVSMGWGGKERTL